MAVNFQFNEELNADRAIKCGKCNSMDLSIDLLTNKKECSKCGNKEIFETVDLDLMREENAEREYDQLQEEAKRGTKRITNNNDYIL